MAQPIYNVVVLDNAGNMLADHVTGTIEQNSFFTAVTVPINAPATAQGRYYISGYIGIAPNGHMWDKPRMRYQQGGMAHAEFVDNPQ